MTTRIAGIDVNTNDDPFGGICLSIFVAGCLKTCPGCQNPELRSFTTGEVVHPVTLFKAIQKRSDLIDSVAFLGGDFINHIPYLWEISEKIKVDLKKRTILYTGELFNQIYRTKVLNFIDVVIDGVYMKDNLSQHIFPASNNQRVWIRDAEDTWFITPVENLPINQGDVNVNP